MAQLLPNKKQNPFSVLILSLLLAACGNGGGSSTTSANASVPSPTSGGTGTAPASDSMSSAAVPSGSTPSGTQTGSFDNPATPPTSSSGSVPSNSGTESPGQTGGTSVPSTPPSGGTTDSSPAIAAHWTLKEIPARPNSVDIYVDLNDSEESLVSYLLVFSSHAASTSGVYVRHADNTLSMYDAFGWLSATPNALNNAGQILATVRNYYPSFYPDSKGIYRALVYTNGSVTLIQPPAGTDPYDETWGGQINNLGEVAGYSSFTDAAGAKQTWGFLFSNGVRHDITPLPGAVRSLAYAINDNSMVAGINEFETGPSRAFTYHAGVMTDIGTLPGYAAIRPVDINNSGQVTGYVYNTQSDSLAVYRPFLYANGIWREIPLPASGGLTGGMPKGINTQGQVVGTLYVFDSVSGALKDTSGFLYAGGKTIDLNTLPEVIATGGRVASATAINNAGQILVQIVRSGIYGWTFYILSQVQ